jgi:hypothetical protein
LGCVGGLVDTPGSTEGTAVGLAAAGLLCVPLCPLGERPELVCPALLGAEPVAAPCPGGGVAEGLLVWASAVVANISAHPISEVRLMVKILQTSPASSTSLDVQISTSPAVILYNMV